jgi:hypothetical protein
MLSDGSTAGVISTNTNHPLVFQTNAAERFRCDSSGRLLVGTSSTSEGSRAVFQGWSGDSAGSAILKFALGAATPAADQYLAYFDFTDSGHLPGARFGAQRDGGTWSASSKPSRLVFSTTANGASSPTERMRIANDGLHSSYSNAVVTVWSSNYSASASNTIFIGRYGATAVNGGSDCIYIRSNGNIQNTNNSYGAISDIKLKENIVDANSQWDDLKALQVRNYNFKEGQTHTQIGLIAQEVELVSPGLVTESPDRDEEGNDLGTVTKSVNYSVLYMKAVKALQEAMERIEALEAKVATLEAA